MDSIMKTLAYRREVRNVVGNHYQTEVVMRNLRNVSPPGFAFDMYAEAAVYLLAAGADPETVVDRVHEVYTHWSRNNVEWEKVVSNYAREMVS